MIVPDGYAQVHAKFLNAAGHLCDCAWGYVITDIPDQTAIDDISDVLATAYKLVLASSSEFLGVHVEVGASPFDLIFDSTSGAGSGTVGGDISSPQVQCLVKKVTGAAGRKNRGRMYVPDVAEAVVDQSGVINVTGRGRADLVATAFFTGVLGVAADFTVPVLLHTDATTPTVIVGFTVEVKAATQRRRLER